MSPRRRLLLLGAVALALVAGLVVVAVVVLPRAGTSRLGQRRDAPQDRPGPVLLVPGYGGGTDALQVLARRLRAAGRTARIVDLPGDGTGDLRRAADALDAAARRELAAGAPSVDVVGYSAGGVTARLWVREHDGATVARRVVTLGSPHHGTEVAAYAAAFATASCPPACQQLVPGSDLLQGLDRGDETPDGPLWTSIWTEQDQTVTPPDSARLAGAVDVPVQQVCPGVQLAHGDLPRNPLVGALVLRALAVTPPTQPPQRSCRIRDLD